MLRFCLVTRAKKEMPDMLFAEAQRSYQQQPEDYDVVLGDLIPEDFRQQARIEAAQKAYLENSDDHRRRRLGRLHEDAKEHGP